MNQTNAQDVFQRKVFQGKLLSGSNLKLMADTMKILKRNWSFLSACHVASGRIEKTSSKDFRGFNVSCRSWNHKRGNVPEVPHIAFLFSLPLFSLIRSLSGLHRKRNYTWGSEPALPLIIMIRLQLNFIHATTIKTSATTISNGRTPNIVLDEPLV